MGKKLLQITTGTDNLSLGLGMMIFEQLQRSTCKELVEPSMYFNVITDNRSFNYTKHLEKFARILCLVSKPYVTYNILFNPNFDYLEVSRLS